MPDVDSTAIRHLRYDRRGATLFVTFHDGDVYRYSGVPKDVYSAFLAADSKGAFFAAHIRDRYAYARIPYSAA